MRNQLTTGDSQSGEKRARLTPKSAKDVKGIRISAVAYEAVYTYASKHNMTMTDAVSFMVETALKHLDKIPLNQAQGAKVSPLEEFYAAINRPAIDKALGQNAAKKPTQDRRRT